MMIDDRCEARRHSDDAWKPGVVMDVDDDKEKGFAYVVKFDGDERLLAVRPSNIRCEHVIRVLSADGTERVLDKVPNYEEMRKIVGGYIEYVNVMDRLTIHDPEPRPVFTRMVVNEEGLLRNLPRNEKATEVYQRNVRHQFKDHEDKFAAADEAWRKLNEAKGLKVIGDITPKDAIAAGYKSDPWIAGDAIYFQGYTTEEVDRIMNEESEKKESKK